MSEIVKVPKIITIESYSDYESALSMNFDEWADWLENIKKTVPDEFMESAIFEIETEYEDGQIRMKATYKRPETEEEEIARIKRSQMYEDAAKIQELKTLAALQKKYGVKK